MMQNNDATDFDNSFFVHPTIAIQGSNLRKKNYRKSEFSEQKQHSKHGGSQQAWKNGKIQIRKGETSGIDRNDTQND